MVDIKGIDCKNNQYQKIDIGRAHDLSNYQIGKLKILWRVNILNKDIGKQVFWLCQCDCGNFVCVSSNKLTSKTRPTKSCGCLQKQAVSQLGTNSRKNLIGIVYNNIKFLSLNENYKKEHNITSKNAYWNCQCVCGKIFTANANEILRNNIISCGCLGTRKSKGEQIIEDILLKNNIKYLYDTAYFKDLKFNNGHLGRYDFILLDNNDKPYRLIEFDGLQHYNNNSYFYHNEQDFIDRQEKDAIKNQYALQHNLPLVRIPYNQLKHLSLDLLMSDTFLIN